MVLPALTPKTVPALTVATDILPLLQVPPDTLEDKVIEVPAQTLSTPVIAPANGSGLIVIGYKTVVVPHVLVTA